LAEELDEDGVCRRFCSIGTANAFGDIRIGQVIHTVKYADGLMLLAEEETVLQGMIDRLSEIGVEINLEKK
jgi:hypothetical protein